MEFPWVDERDGGEETGRIDWEGMPPQGECEEDVYRGSPSATDRQAGRTSRQWSADVSAQPQETEPSQSDPLSFGMQFA